MNSAKKNADEGVSSHNEHDSLTFFSVNILQAKNGKLLIVVCFTRLRCTHTYFRMTTFALFLLYENPTNSSFHRI